MTNYNDGKWHGHNGGECPVHPETVVEYITAVAGPERKESSYGQFQADRLSWVMCQDGWVVVAFRVIKEYKQPREFWVHNGNAYPSESVAQEFGSKYDIIHVREVIK